MERPDLKIRQLMSLFDNDRNEPFGTKVKRISRNTGDAIGKGAVGGMTGGALGGLTGAVGGYMDKGAAGVVPGAIDGAKLGGAVGAVSGALTPTINRELGDPQQLAADDEDPFDADSQGANMKAGPFDVTINAKVDDIDSLKALMMKLSALDTDPGFDTSMDNTPCGHDDEHHDDSEVEPVQPCDNPHYSTDKQVLVNYLKDQLKNRL